MILLAVVAIAAAVILIPKGGSATLRGGTMTLELTTKAVIIRDENCVSVEKFDRVDHLVNEGSQVNAETPVAMVYKWGYTDDMAQALITIQQKIYEKQLAILDGIQTAELSSINTQIDEKRQAIASGEGTTDLLQLETELEALLNQRAAYLLGSVQPDIELNSLYAEETAKKAQIAEYTSTVAAKLTGLVSFYFDGYEQVLSADKLDVVNADLVTNIINGAAGSTSADQTLLYRLVNPVRWYVAFVTPSNDAFRLSSGASYTVAFEGVHGRVFSGTALPSVAYDGGVVNMLEFSEEIGSLMSARAVSATITAPMTGYRVDKGAVKVKDGVPVLSLSGGADVEVQAVASEEDELLITGAGLQDGLKYKK